MSKPKKQNKKNLRPRYSTTPPPGWPTEKEWVEIEKKLAQKPVTTTLSIHATPIDRLKYELCGHFVIYKQEHKITQREFAKILGVTESRVSELIHYHFQRFTIDKLYDLLTRIKPRLKLKVA